MSVFHVPSHSLPESKFPPADRTLEIFVVGVHDNDMFFEVSGCEEAFGTM